MQDTEGSITKSEILFRWFSSILCGQTIRNGEATIEDLAWENLFLRVSVETDSEHVLSLQKLRKVAVSTQIECSMDELSGELRSCRKKR